MASTLVAADIFGSFEGFDTTFGLGSLTPATLNGFPCELLITGLVAGRISASFTGDAVSAMTGEDIAVDGSNYTIVGTPTYNSGDNTTTVEWTYGPGNFVVGNSYSVEIGAATGAISGTSGVATTTSGNISGGSASAPDFKILRGSAIIPSSQTSLTLTDTTDYTLESGIASDAWFFQIANSNLSGMGRTVGGGNQNSDDFMVSCSTSGNNVTLTRRGSANDCRVDWQIIQYIGSSGGANEIKVRATGTATAASSSATTSASIPGTVSNNADLVPFITGQDNASTGRNDPHAGLFTANINGSNVDFQRGRTNVAATVSYALVEFTGSNWTITNEQFSNPSAANTDSTVTLSTAVADIAQTFLHCQYRYDLEGTAGLDDASTRVRLSSTTQFSVRDTTTTGDASKNHSVWVIQNPDISVARYTGTMTGSGEEEVADIAITAVADTAQVLTTLTNDSTGSGTALPRGFVNHLLTDASTVRLRQSDNGQTSQYAIEVVTLPESSGGGGSSQIAGLASAITTASGVIQASAALGGATAQAFTADGSITGNADISGTVTTSFATTATGQALGAVSGAASTQTALNGNVAASGALIGSSTAVTTTQAALIATGSLLGPTSISFTAAGTITGSAPTELTGQTAGTFSASGNIAGRGRLTGQSGTAHTVSANGQLTGYISGESVSSHTGGGNLSASGTLTGLTSTAASANGVLAANGLLAGSTASSVSTTGGLAGLLGGAISGSITINEIVSGALTAKATMSGINSCSFTLNGNAVDQPIRIYGPSNTNGYETTGGAMANDITETCPAKGASQSIEGQAQSGGLTIYGPANVEDMEAA